MIVEPRVVEAGRGFGWWAEGWRIFMSSPGTWILMMIVYGILTVLVNVVPFVGTVGQSLLTPVFIGGFMIGCRALERGEPLRVSHLFEGFQGPHFVRLMIIGVVNIGLVIVLFLVSGAGMLGSFGLRELSALSNPMDPLAAPLQAMSVTGLFILLAVLVLAAVFAMLNWFAPALVALRGVSATEAMKLSFVSCLRNWLPFLLYGLVVVVAGIVMTIAVVVLAFLFGGGVLAFLLGGGAMSGSIEGAISAFLGVFLLMFAVFGLLTVIVGPIAIGSVYAGFKDTVDDDDATVTNPAYR